MSEDDSRFLKSVVVRSASRTSTSTGTNSFQVMVSASKALFGRYMASYLQMPMGAYPVGSTNNVIYFNEPSGGGNLTATLTAGNYAITTLATQVASAMTTASGGYATYSCTGSATTGKLTISSTQNFILQWGSFSTSSAYKVLGFNAANTPSATSATGPNLVDLSYPPAVIITINESSEDGVKTTAGLNGSLWVPFESTFGDLVGLPADQIPQTVNFQSPTTRLTVQVTDEDGTLVNLNGVEWRLVLRKYGSFPETASIPSA